MALKVLMLRQRLDRLRAALEELTAKDSEFEAREAELTNDIEAVTNDEEQNAVDAAIEQYETDKNAHDAEKERLAGEIEQLEAEINENEQKQTPPPADDRVAKPNERKRANDMAFEKRYRDMTRDERGSFVEREDVKKFLERVREFGTQNRAISGADLLIPEILLGMIRTEAAASSKLMRFFRVVNVSGSTRQNIMGNIPEAVWTEMCAALNELTFGFNQVEVDGYKVGGYIAICNAVLADSDINLAAEIISVFGGAIAKALDKSSLFGTGVKMPTGIATRLAQTSQPETWGARAPAWTDLHTSNVLTLNTATASGVEFFSALIGALSVAKPKYSSDGLFWVMNRKTHLDILTKSLNYNAAGTIVTGVDTFPIIGGAIVELEDDEISDYEIIGGFGGNYLLAQRQGATFAQSEHVRFLEEQTVFKGSARYDGMPIAGEAFVIVNYNNTAPTTSKSFPVDYANASMNVLTVTAAAGGATGKTVLTVTDTIAQSSVKLVYKVKATVEGVKVGDTVNSTWAELTSGTTAITAAAGVQIAVLELDSNDRVVSAGTVISIPKSA